MIEYLINNMWQLWTIVAIVCLIIELSSGDFFVICFAFGAVLGVVGALAGCNVYLQILLFALASLASIFFIRPVALRYLHKNEPNRPSNADALIGRTGRVVEPIADGGYGYVAIDGDMWKACSTEATDIAKDTVVRVVDRQSTIITVIPQTKI